MSTITHDTVILTIPIYRDEDADLLNYSTEDDRVLPGDCYEPLIAAGRPVNAEVFIRVDLTTDAEGFTDRDVAIMYQLGASDSPLAGFAVSLMLTKKITSDLAEFFRDEIARAGL